LPNVVLASRADNEKQFDDFFNGEVIEK